MQHIHLAVCLCNGPPIFGLQNVNSSMMAINVHGILHSDFIFSVKQVLNVPKHGSA